ncbi:MAG TPA: hypothetical protein DCO75_08105 [Fibrobacteres bacterium]|nr:hypothetical protein [Fibrobacterota bacterium]
MRMTKLCFLMCSLFCCISVYGQATPVKKILFTSFSDQTVNTQEEKIKCLDGSFLGVPFIDDVELKLRNSQFDINYMRYTLQVKPKGFGETGALYHYNRSLFDKTDQKKKLLVNEALKERYLLVIDFWEQENVLQMYDDLITLYDDKIKVMETRTFDTKFDLNDLIIAENENTRLRAQRFDLQKLIGLISDTAGYYLGDTSFNSFDTAGLVDIETIIGLIDKTSFSLDTNNVYLENLRLDFQLARTRYDLEKAQSRRYINDLSFAYNNGSYLDEINKRNADKSYNTDKAYFFEVGFKIPDLTLSHLQVNKKEADLLTAKEDYEQLKRDLANKMKKDLADIRSLLSQYKFMKARENEVDATASLKKYLQMTGIDPLVLLSTKESIVKNRITMAKIRFDILRNYIHVMDITGELSRQPLVNYLSLSREVIDK